MTRKKSLARLTVVSLAVLGSGSALLLAQAPEPALHTPANDPKIAWGPCPDILPAGCQIAALHGDPAKPNVDVFLKLPAKSSFTKHKHTSAERMILLSGEMHVTFEGQKQAVVKAGSYMYGPAGRAHSGACASAEPCLVFIAFEGPVDATAVN